jgi:hypothetical protein
MKRSSLPLLFILSGGVLLLGIMAVSSTGPAEGVYQRGGLDATHRSDHLEVSGDPAAGKDFDSEPAW